jgi:hypothetical protein
LSIHCTAKRGELSSQVLIFFAGSGGGLPQQGFEFSEELFDGRLLLLLPGGCCCTARSTSGGRCVCGWGLQALSAGSNAGAVKLL